MKRGVFVFSASCAIGASMSGLVLQGTPVSAQNIGDYVCRVGWGFPAGDKQYTGIGKTEDLAMQSARSNCAKDQALDQYKQICGSEPKAKSCNQVQAPLPPPPGPAPTLIFCKKPTSPEDAARIKNLPLQSVISDNHGEGSRADPKNVAHPRIDLPPGTNVSVVYCRVQDEKGEAWCADTPESPAGCDYWAWTKRQSSWYPRVQWKNDHWRLQVSFYNQKHDRKRQFQIFAE